MASTLDEDVDKGGYRQINKALNIHAFDDYLKGQVANLPHLPNVEQLTPRVLRILGQNPGRFTFQGTNTFIIGTGESRILIDTSGGEPEYATLLASVLEAQHISLKYVLVTHWHGDHSGGASDLVRMYPHLSDHIYKNDPEPGQQNIADGQVFRVDGATITAVHTPGHSEDHMCFILDEEQSMFTGDNILGHGTSAFEDLGLYMLSLQKMAGKRCSTGHPAHGVTIHDLPAKIAAELDQKLRREKQVMNALYQLCGQGESSASVRDVVNNIYGDSVDETTQALALEPFVDEVLRKLANDYEVGFEIRNGTKKWYPIQLRQRSPRFQAGRFPSTRMNESTIATE